MSAQRHGKCLQCPLDAIDITSPCNGVSIREREAVASYRTFPPEGPRRDAGPEAEAPACRVRSTLEGCQCGSPPLPRLGQSRYILVSLKALRQSPFTKASRSACLPQQGSDGYGGFRPHRHGEVRTQVGGGVGPDGPRACWGVCPFPCTIFARSSHLSQECYR